VGSLLTVIRSGILETTLKMAALLGQEAIEELSLSVVFQFFLRTSFYLGLSRLGMMLLLFFLAVVALAETEI